MATAEELAHSGLDGDPRVVVITDTELPGADRQMETLRAAGLDPRLGNCRTPEDVVAAAQDAAAIVVQWAPVTAEVLERLTELRFVGRLGIGYDMIDVDAATRLGIAVANTPDYCLEEVAAHTLALMLSLARGLRPRDRSVREGRWSVREPGVPAVRPSATEVAVIGFGRIGSRVAAACRAIGFRVLVCDPYVDATAVEHAGHEHVPLADALARADILTLHVPLTSTTSCLIDRAAIDQLKPGSLLVNTCRGALIDEPALVDALRGGHLGGAGLDVFADEPLPEGSPLRELQNVVLTPHAAWYSPEAEAELPDRTVAQVVDFLSGRPVPTIVNPGYAAGTRAGTILP